MMKVVIENGLRKISPYYFRNKIYSKERWFKRTVYDVLNKEFNGYINDDICIYKAKLKCLLKNQDALDSIMENGDVLEYTTHFHEPAVVDFGLNIEIVKADEELLVVNKPAGIPTHPSGKYRLNSLTEILAAQVGHPVYPAHRLDRLTSGVVVLGRTASATSKFRKELSNVYGVSKEYYAKVKGRFNTEQEEGIIFDFDLFDIDGNRDFNHFLKAFNGRKNAITRIKLVKYNDIDNTSIVSCIPITGRTHQIRKHLAIMGYPIVNDKLYNRPVFHDISLLLERFSVEDGLIKELEMKFNELQEATRRSREEKLLDTTVCSECNVQLFKDAPVEEMMIYLHAKQYICRLGGDIIWNYEAKLPKWCE